MELKSFKTILEASKKFTELPSINFRWNPSKIKNGKMLSQLNQRLTLPHLTKVSIIDILNNGIKEGLKKNTQKQTDNSDVCIRFLNSSFTVVYNVKDDYIRSIRVDLKVNCKNTKRVFETYEEKKLLGEALDVKSFDDYEIIDGVKLTTIGYVIEATLVCNCIEVNY